MLLSACDGQGEGKTQNAGSQREIVFMLTEWPVLQRMNRFGRRRRKDPAIGNSVQLDLTSQGGALRAQPKKNIRQSGRVFVGAGASNMLRRRSALI